MKTSRETLEEILQLAATHFRTPRGELSGDDDFFEKLGIDSLKALELLTRIENHFGQEALVTPDEPALEELGREAHQSPST